jgi:hypothetical protein
MPKIGVILNQEIKATIFKNVDLQSCLYLVSYLVAHDKILEVAAELASPVMTADSYCGRSSNQFKSFICLSVRHLASTLLLDSFFEHVAALLIAYLQLDCEKL